MYLFYSMTSSNFHIDALFFVFFFFLRFEFKYVSFCVAPVYFISLCACVRNFYEK